MLFARAALVLLLCAPASLAAQVGASTSEGEEIFTLVCAMCHSIHPPAKLAPPLSHAAAYYLRAYPDAESAATAMVAFLRDPVAERSAMPAHAVERFGLMPPQSHLSAAQLLQVARYALSIADTAHVRAAPGGGERLNGFAGGSR